MKRTANVVVVMGASFALACAPKAVMAPSESAPSAPPSASASAHAVAATDFEVIAVDDQDDFVAHVAEDALPPTFEVRWENVPDGPGRTTKTSFVHARAERQDTPAAVFDRATRWSSAMALAPGKRIVWEEIVEEDLEARRATFAGVRSYVVAGEPILTAIDIESASPVVSDAGGTHQVYVALVLTAAAAKRFADATDAHRQRRLAILVGGRVWAAPVVRTRIEAGRVSITMALDAPDAQLARANALAEALGAHAH